MGKRPVAYWVVVIAALVIVGVAFYMVRSADPRLHDIGRYMGWGAIALLLIARFALRPKTPPTPPMPRD